MGFLRSGSSRRTTGSSSKYFVRKNGETSVVNKSPRGAKEEDYDGPKRQVRRSRFDSDDDDKYGGPSRGRQESRRVARDDYEDRGRGRGYGARSAKPDSYDDKYNAPRRRASPDEYDDYPRRRGYRSRRPSPENSPPSRARPKPRRVSPDYDDDYSPPSRPKPKRRNASPDYDEYRGRGGRPRFEPSDDEDEYGGGPRPRLVPLSFQVRDEDYARPRKPAGPRLRRASTDSESSEYHGGGGRHYASRGEPEVVEVGPKDYYKGLEVIYPDEIEEPD